MNFYSEFGKMMNSMSVCRPGAFSEFKHGFIQWLSAFIVVGTAFSWFEGILFRFRALDTFCTFDVRQTKGF
jgi:hypothetical protein